MSINILLDPIVKTQEWSKLYANTLNCDTINTNYITTQAESIGQFIVSNGQQSAVLPSLGMGSHATFAPVLNRLVFSTSTLVNASVYSNDGLTFTAVTAPASLIIEWSPSLSLFSCINASNTQIYTSLNGTTVFTLSPSTVPFAWNSTALKWIPELNMFLAGNSNLISRVYYSLNGTTYFQTNNTLLQANGFAYSDTLGMVISYGPSGTQYSYDGINWNPSVTLIPFNGICWSKAYNRFTALATNSNTYAFESYDGSNWTAYTAFTINLVNTSIEYFDALGVYVVGGTAFAVNRMTVSVDGRNFKYIYVPPTQLVNYTCLIYVAQWGMLYGSTSTNGTYSFTPKRYLF